jgi:hypothetical protein
MLTTSFAKHKMNWPQCLVFILKKTDLACKTAGKAKFETQHQTSGSLVEQQSVVTYFCRTSLSLGAF